MPNFLVLYRAERDPDAPSVLQMLTSAPPEKLAAGMTLWRTWHEKRRSAIVDIGTPLDNSRLITEDRSGHHHTLVSGYSIIRADTIDEAVALVKDHPHLIMPKASIEVLECVPLPI